MAANHRNVTQSNMKAFTPMGEKHLEKSDVSHLIPCEVTGESVLRPTVVYLKPSQLAPKRRKYANLGQKLAIPFNMLHLVKEEEPIIVEKLPIAPLAKKGCRYVICLNSGKVYSSVQEAATKNKLTPELLSVHLRGVTKSAKGRRMRYATPEEVEEFGVNPDWTYSGELLPLLPAAGRKA